MFRPGGLSEHSVDKSGQGIFMSLLEVGYMLLNETGSNGGALRISDAANKGTFADSP
jgi:hypothetical protein